MMARRMRRKSHVRCRAGEKVEIISNPYLLLYDFTQPKPITHQAAWALLHERPDICEKHIWNQITSE